MKQKRRNHSPEFKARIALEAIRGVKTVQQIAADNHLHPVQVAQWKGQMLESAAGVFERAGSREARAREEEKEKARLERKVGQLVVEVDWLKKMQGAGDRSMRRAMAEKSGSQLSVRRQCELLGLNRNRLGSADRKGLGSEDLEMVRRIDELHLRFPEFGARRMRKWLQREGWEEASRRRVSRVMRLMGLEAI